MANEGIIICGARYPIDHRVLTYEDPSGFSAYLPHRSDDRSKVFASTPCPGLEHRITRYRARRSMGGDRSLSRLKAVVKQLVVHLDGCRNSAMCYDVLHNQRGLSAHFLVDNDGTIYQTLDLLDCAFHAGGVNEISIGIELSNRGDAAKYPNYYKEGRDTLTCRIHGAQFLAYDFTLKQYEAMMHLSRLLTQVFDIPLRFPLTNAREAIWTKLDQPRRFSGFVGHYHLSTNKWDPGPWDFPRLLQSIGSSVSFPFSEKVDRLLNQSPKIQAKLEQEADRYFDNAEQDTTVYFPVGPLGRSRLWHGGIHLKAPEQKKIRSMFNGKIVAAKFGSDCPIGSCNFILMRHQLSFAGRPWTFFSLFYHLFWNNTDIKHSTRGISWLERIYKKNKLDQGQTLLLDHAIQAGEYIGKVGRAGPIDHRSPQIHLAIFSAEELTREFDPGYFELYDDGSRSRLCNSPKLIKKIDRPVGSAPPDGMLSRRELRNFFRYSADRYKMRNAVAHHRTEWSDGDWEKELLLAEDFKRLSSSRRTRLIEDQIKPSLWWTKDLAKHSGLPNDEMVYSYQPITFILWYHKMLEKMGNTRMKGLGSAKDWEGKMAPSHLTVDGESSVDATDAEDIYSGKRNQSLTLEDLVNGYPEEK